MTAEDAREGGGELGLVGVKREDVISGAEEAILWVGLRVYERDVAESQMAREGQWKGERR